MDHDRGYETARVVWIKAADDTSSFRRPSKKVEGGTPMDDPFG
jgi:hypothetical protein